MRVSPLHLYAPRHSFIFPHPVSAPALCAVLAISARMLDNLNALELLQSPIGSNLSGPQLFSLRSLLFHFCWVIV